jgi:sialate O-acetylesterase
MEWSLAQSEGAEAAIPRADHPQIRLYHLRKRHDTYRTPYTAEESAAFNRGDFFAPGQWAASTPETAADFSAVAYYFGRALHDSLKVPIGLIQAAVGGSPAQSWVSEAALTSHPQLAHLVAGDKNWLHSPIIHPWLSERARQNWAELEVDEMNLPGHPFAPAYLFGAAIEPLLPYAIRGAIWYQGESNATHPDAYTAMQNALIQDWRNHFEQPALPFLFVQLPRIGNRSRWPDFRAAQAESLQLPHTAMAVTIDQGHPTDVHPRQKQPVGERLSYLALDRVYAFSHIPERPVLTSHVWNKTQYQITLQFDQVPEGLRTTHGDRQQAFTLSGYTDEGSTYTTIVPKTIFAEHYKITLIYPENFMPITVQYAHLPFPKHILENSDNLPLAPFQIDLTGNN